MIRKLGVQLDDSRISIECDNTMTVRLVTAEIATLKTKLRHVDIHNHWLRQVQNGAINVMYTESAEMMADGLTKALPTGKFESFREMMGLEDVGEMIRERRDAERAAPAPADDGQEMDWEPEPHAERHSSSSFAVQRLS